MKNDYLWDKTGRDPEIEGLEDLLSAFSHKEMDPPMLPEPETRSIVHNSPRRYFSFSLAFATGAAAIVLAIVWFQSVPVPSTPQIDVVSYEPQRTESSTNTPASTEVQESQVSTRNGKVLAKDATLLNTRPLPVRVEGTRGAAPVAAQKAVQKAVQKRDTVVALTREERYAYNQLMLALSITGSKLKIVQDKVNGIRERHSPAIDNRRKFN